VRRLTVLLAILIALSIPAGPADAPPDAATVLARASEDGLARLARRAAEERPAFDPAALMRFCLSSYFTTYPTLEGAGEQERLLSALERIVAAFGHGLIEEAGQRAAGAGQVAIDAAPMAAVVRDRMRAERTPFDTLRFFSHRREAHRVDIELVDLEAMRDTGLAWRALGALARDRERLKALPPIDAAAAPVVAEALTSYALLVLRLAGDSARRAFDPAVTAPHLREAERRVRALSGNAPLPPPAAPPPADEGPFTDVTAAAGIRFRHTTHPWLARFRRYGPPAPSFSGGGVSAGDLDGDRLTDLVFCGGRGCSYFRNRGDGTFSDETEASGLRVEGEARMAVVADFDNDGDADVFITYAHQGNRLFENLGGGRFRDVTAASGLSRDGDIGGPAVAFDADNDGLLDIYVGNFGDYVSGASPWDTPDARNAQPNRLFRNRGGLRFTDVTERAGVGDTGWAQAVGAADLDGDGWQDLYVANDFGRNELFRNRGDGTFEAVGAAWGADCRFHGMNVAFADLNRDRRPEILVTNIWGWSPAQEAPEEYNTLLVSKREAGGMRYERRTPRSFLKADSGWAWAALFFDQDLDGDDDLFVVNGHSDYAVFVQYRRHPQVPGRLYPINNGREPNLFYVNEGGELRHPSSRTAAALPDENSRGLALLDYDADGDLDMALSTFHSWGRLFANRGGPGNWLVLELEGDPKRGVSREAIGAQVVVTGPAGLQVWRTITAADGYLSQSARPVHVGLGAATSVEIEVLWPGGATDRYRTARVNGWFAVRQGDPALRPLPRPGSQAR
jgi:hypothetical protein